MPIWSTDYLNRVALEAEIEIAKQLNCIIDRYSLAVEQYLETYLLPEYVNNIRRVLWKGIRLDPVTNITSWPYIVISDNTFFLDESIFDLPVFDSSSFANNPLTEYSSGGYERQAYSNGFDVGSYQVVHGSAGNRPTQYFYSGYGENVIKFNAPPNESIAEVNSGLWDTNIANSVIIEFYRIPDGSTFTIPTYIRRRTIKNYVLWKAFAKEGIGQNLNASQYYERRYLISLERARTIIYNIYRTTNTTRTDSYVKELDRDFLKRRGPLPANYGIPVGDWDD